MRIELKANKGRVMEEVFEASSYTAAKAEDYSDAKLDRIQTTKKDEEHLEIFWNEGRAAVHQALMGLVLDDSLGADGDYTLRLNVSEAFDTALQPSMEVSLHNYFVQAITGRWFVYTNKGEAGAYAQNAALLLEDIDRKARWKRPPSRPRRPRIQ